MAGQEVSGILDAHPPLDAGFKEIAYDAGSTDRDAIKDALAATQGFPMLQGEANCDENHAFVHSASVAHIEDNVPVLYGVVEG